MAAPCWARRWCLPSGPRPYSLLRKAEFGIPVPEEGNLLEGFLGIQTTSAPPVGVETTKTLPEARAAPLRGPLGASQVSLLSEEQTPVATVGSQVRLSPPTASSAFLSPAFAVDVGRPESGRDELLRWAWESKWPSSGPWPMLPRVRPGSRSAQVTV